MGFDVKPEELAGFAAMVNELLKPYDEAVQVIGVHGGADGLGGLLGEAVGSAIAEASGKVGNLVSDGRHALHRTVISLNQAALTYWSDEAAATGRFRGAKGNDDQWPGPDAANYPLNPYPALPAPESALPSPEDVADDLSGLAEVISFLIELAGFGDPVAEGLERLMSDWRVLDEAGIAMESAGDRLYHVKQDIDIGLARLLQHWDGEAADGFEEHCTRLSAAIGDIAASSRILGECYQVGALVAKMCAEKLVQGIDEACDNFFGVGWKFLVKLLARAIPFLGQALMAKDAANLLNHLIHLVTNLERLLNDVAQRLRQACIRQVVANLGGTAMQAGRINLSVDKIVGAAADLGPKVMTAADKIWDQREVDLDSRRLNNSPDDIANMPTTDDPYDVGDYQEKK